MAALVAGEAERVACVVGAVVQNERVGEPGHEDEADAENCGDQRGLEHLGADGGNGTSVERDGMRSHSNLPRRPTGSFGVSTRRQVSWLALHRRVPPSRSLAKSVASARVSTPTVAGAAALRPD